MEVFKTCLDKIITVLGVLILIVLMATVPSLLIWNHILAPKFGLPFVSLWEMVCIILFVRIIMPNKFKK